MSMHNTIREAIYSRDESRVYSDLSLVRGEVESMIIRAFDKGDDDALIAVHRVLYVINMAQLAGPDDKCPWNIKNPIISKMKYDIERAWDISERKKYVDILASLPDTSDFPQWISRLVKEHSSMDVHPLFYFFRDKADLQQLREFFVQETPLEMLFGDIVALMMPGVYGKIKIELVKNFWDEVGRARDELVHRNLRAKLMRHLEIEPDFYKEDVERFVVEELALINMYMAMATDRAKLLQLIGVMLATELMIPGRFPFLVEAWKRNGIDGHLLDYFVEHISVDAVHAEDWLNEVVVPIISGCSGKMEDIVLGVLRRLDTADAVCNKMVDHLQK